MTTATLLQGDCREVLATLPADSIDSIISDPPYELGLMGKAWDSSGVAFDPKMWAAVLRVAKPGAFLLAFGGTRTWHRLAAAIEDAGWEVRDAMAWLYGTGFPKALDVSKAIDKLRVEDVEPTRAICRFLRAAMDARGLKSRNLIVHFGNCNPRLIDHWAARDSDSQPEVPPWEHWLTLKTALGLDDSMDAEVWRLNGKKGKPGDAWNGAEIIGEYEHGPSGGLVGVEFTARDRFIREPSARAAAWKGWASNLKPAWEPIVVAMKPLEGTYAENALRHGVAGLNVKGARIERAPGDREQVGWWKTGSPESENKSMSGKNYARGPKEPPAGRWPVNVLLDEDAARQLDAQAEGVSRFFKVVKAGRFSAPAIGGTSRFLYCPKPGTGERGSGNDHPTVKPVELLRYLCRLTRTPAGGIVLDPFMGSGTTGVAARAEGRAFVGIEIDGHYHDIARRRIDGEAGTDAA
jgi:DNA modification methylase